MRVLELVVAISLAKNKLKGDFLVISGDILKDFNLNEIIDFHVRFLEKPPCWEVFSDTINTGIYVLSPKIFELVPKKKEFDFSKNLLPLLLKKNLPIYGFISSGYWRDIRNVKEYKLSHEDIINGQVDIEIEGERALRIDSDIWIGKGCDYKKYEKSSWNCCFGKKCKNWKLQLDLNS